MPPQDELSLFAIRLEEVGAPYMVTGATAAILYGQPRVTNDLDVVIALDQDAEGDPECSCADVVLVFFRMDKTTGEREERPRLFSRYDYRAGKVAKENPEGEGSPSAEDSFRRCAEQGQSWLRGWGNATRACANFFDARSISASFQRNRSGPGDAQLREPS